jgi:hypothetical protein
MFSRAIKTDVLTSLINAEEGIFNLSLGASEYAKGPFVMEGAYVSSSRASMEIPALGFMRADQVLFLTVYRRTDHCDFLFVANPQRSERDRPRNCEFPILSATQHG